MSRFFARAQGGAAFGRNQGQNRRGGGNAQGGRANDEDDEIERPEDDNGLVGPCPECGSPVYLNTQPWANIACSNRPLCRFQLKLPRTLISSEVVDLGCPLCIHGPVRKVRLKWVPAAPLQAQAPPWQSLQKCIPYKHSTSFQNATAFCTTQG